MKYINILDFKFNKATVKYLFIFYSLFLSTMVAFAQQPSAGGTLRINPSSAASVMTSQVFDGVDYIPLETTNESLFGAINKLFVTDKYFIILDYDTHCVLLFFKNGKFHCKINFDAHTNGITVNKGRNEIVFNKNGDLWYYDFNGKKLREGHEKFIGESYYFSKNRVAYAFYSADEKYYSDTTSHQLFLTNENKVYANFLPYNNKKTTVQSKDIFYAPAFYDIGSDTAVYFRRPYDYSIYQLTTTRLSKQYSFIFPLANSLPDGFYSDTSLKNKKLLYIQKHTDLIYGIGFPYQTGNNLFFRLDQWNAKSDSYMYNLNSGNLISIRYTHPDSLTYYLPLTDLNDGVEFANQNFLACDGKYIYTALSSAIMFKYNDANADKKVQYNAVLKVYFAKRNRKDNPVIVQIKPKESF
jgi:hypothetical protein